MIGSNGICDEGWHAWRIVVRGADNQPLSRWKTDRAPSKQPGLAGRTDLGIGVSVRDTFVSFDDVRVAKGD